jgi:glutamate synthase (NADPH/NADH) small chain
VPGRELDGVHFAMEYLYVRNRAVAGSDDRSITAEGKHVVVIGGGDTGADCVGNSVREGAASVVQLELLPEPPANRPDDRTPWPLWPQKFRLSYAMEEARAVGRGEQDFSVVTTHFEGDADGRVHKLHYAQAEAAPPFKPVEGTGGELRADLVLLAMGFLHPEHDGAVDQLGVEKDQRGNVKAATYETSVPGVFAAGDARRGQSLIVWAINEGRQCARMVNRHLKALDGGSGRAMTAGPGGDADEGPAGPPRIASPAL